ncbi:MAG: tetratricopeptide repeat protein [Chloroflexota bacterium]|nr:tetratricopeptide repeat protein [Chloroflexota bacterium]
MKEHEAERLARRHFERGYRLQQEGRPGHALREYRRSIALFPTAEAYTFLGWALSTLGRYEEAIEHCQTAISLDPDYGNPYNDIGAYLIELERWDEAAPWLRLALSAPNYAARYYAHYNLGRVHQHYGRYRDARASYRTALKEEPTFEVAQTALMKVTALLN